jgi:hypothetical protein
VEVLIFVFGIYSAFLSIIVIFFQNLRKEYIFIDKNAKSAKVEGRKFKFF